MTISSTPEGVSVEPRHLRFDVSEDLKTLWHGNDAFRTAFFNALSLQFPDGEQQFINAVRLYRDRIEDPKLQAEIRGFIGQEALHSREHKHYNEALRARGYDIDAIDRRFGKHMEWVGQLPPSRQLAGTCGAEHYTTDHRWRDGYRHENRPEHESGFDLNRWTWQRKRKHWRRPLQILCPSHWLAGCVRRCALMADWPVTVVPNAIDTDRWQPIDQRLARQLLGLPQDCPLLLFGAMGGGMDPRKGGDVLLAALVQLSGEPSLKSMQLVVFGQLAPQKPRSSDFRCITPATCTMTSACARSTALLM